MNGWDVLSDAIKIGVPSLLAWATGRSVLKATHSYAERSERRKAAQQALESLVKEVTSMRATFGDHIRYRIDHDIRGKARLRDLDDREIERLERLQQQMTDLEHRHALLTLLGLGNVVEHLYAYFDANRDLREAFKKSTTEEELDRLTDSATSRFSEFVRSVAAEYKKL